MDVIIIGAGPSGYVAAALLVQRGHSVLVLEREQFPRFSIGESLLPHCMEFIEEAGMLGAVNSAKFQRKVGANFQRRGEYSGFDFREKFSDGPDKTFQVTRADFDKILADEAEKQGAHIRYGHQITSIDFSGALARVSCETTEGRSEEYEASFVLDASGFGRVLPRLLNLESPSGFPVRASLFCHVKDQISDPEFDREKILITVHPKERDVWYWLIPFSGGRSSIGVVAEPEFLNRYPEDSNTRLQAIVSEDPELMRLLGSAIWDTESRQITGYSANVSTLATSKYALLGNAGEFLDPIFSSGVTIAMRSASMAVSTLDRQLRGMTVNWQEEYAEPLKRGVNTFREFVTAWYDGRLQDIIFYENKSDEVKSMICSILAGYAWDEKNAYVRSPKKRLSTLWNFCESNNQRQSEVATEKFS